jgi:hypothetical protein
MRCAKATSDAPGGQGQFSDRPMRADAGLRMRGFDSLHAILHLSRRWYCFDDSKSA